MWMRRASRGRLLRPLSWREVRGIDGFEIAAGAAGWEGCEGADTGWDGGEVWPFV